MRVSVVHSRCLDKSPVANGFWVYADDDHRINRRAINQFSKSLQRLMTPAEFQRIMEDLRPLFVAWVDKNLFNVPREQWLTTALSKNPYHHHLYLHASWLVVITNAVMKHRRDLVVVTASFGLALALKEFCKSHEVDYHCSGLKYFLRGQMYCGLKALRPEQW